MEAANVTTNSTVGLELEAEYCGQGLDDFHTGYVKVHGYLSVAICLFGCIANTLNIIVLTRREMRSPTNAILTGLAVADLLVMLDYIPYAVITNILPLYKVSVEHRLSYSATWFVLLHSIFSQIYHTISIWLTVTLAIWRYIAVGYPQRNRLWCGMRQTLWAIASSYVVCPFIAIPLYATMQIAPKLTQVQTTAFVSNADGGGGDLVQIQRNVTIYRIEQNELANSRLMYHVNLWIYSVAIKLIPCVALTILSQRLIAALMEAKRRRKMLTANSAMAMKAMTTNGSKSATGAVTGGGSGPDGADSGATKSAMAKSSKNLEKEKQTDRTTRMLLAVLLLFLLTEFPQGILAVLASLLGPNFFMNCYMKLADITDMLALLNSAINFILYCSMSRQFRLTFGKLFRPRFLDRWLPVQQLDDDDDAGGGGGGRTDANGCRGGRSGNGRHGNGNGAHTTTQVTQV